ncbi:thiol-disulfide isomerase/thioredoxin [Inhella inkyongensis]|uniref:Thiol-disulfide isomerase/thioredoxin n=1 Tax=Inhella inkyongensis TaxID=392593 RepID=A0A840SAH1_9BURK|nr:TlpA disulfide reductase family protein [Inhella inkyongensis]MBB5205784.1 thiol-disulfide isomerase/thioredoxin [Inhella inkyongensis]
MGMGLKVLLGWMLAAALAGHGHGEAAGLKGRSADGRLFDLAQQRGRVVMVVYWASTCAPCRTVLPELRANLRGWKDQPFDLVSVSLDARETDWREYERLAAITQPDAAMRGISLWRGARDTQDALQPGSPRKLPLTLVLDAQGREVQRYEGRVPAKAWDAVAELLP